MSRRRFRVVGRSEQPRRSTIETTEDVPAIAQAEPISRAELYRRGEFVGCLGHAAHLEVAVEVWDVRDVPTLVLVTSRGLASIPFDQVSDHLVELATKRADR